jgi:hypothetical protein
VFQAFTSLSLSCRRSFPSQVSRQT